MSLSINNRAVALAHQKGYRITDDGVLLFIKEGQKPRQIKGSIDYKGDNKTVPYRRTGIRLDGKVRRLMFHRLQAYQKFGDKIFQKGIEVRHLNGNSLDNSYDNIGIGTLTDNRRDREKHRKNGN